MNSIELGWFGSEHHLAYEMRALLDLDMDLPEKQLTEAALRAIKFQNMCGAIALKFVQSAMFTRHAVRPNHRPPLLFHGSPQHGLKVLEPRQATWTYREPGVPLNYNHGRPAICSSATTHLPVLRALFHESRPELKGLPLVLKRAVDAFGTAHWVTSYEALGELSGSGSRGSVYGFDNPGPSSSFQTGYEYDLERKEYRIYGTRSPLVEVRVGMRDLPTNVYAIPAAERDKLQNFGDFANPVKWAMRMDVHLGQV